LFLPVTCDSSDAVMLSAESAAGKYPLESVTMQQLVINKVESDEVFRKSLDRFAAEYEAHRLSARNTITSAITLAARQVRCF
jgi:pyruvate kinase